MTVNHRQSCRAWRSSELWRQLWIFPRSFCSSLPSSCSCSSSCYLVKQWPQPFSSPLVPSHLCFLSIVPLMLSKSTVHQPAWCPSLSALWLKQTTEVFFSLGWPNQNEIPSFAYTHSFSISLCCTYTYMYIFTLNQVRENSKWKLNKFNEILDIRKLDIRNCDVLFFFRFSPEFQESFHIIEGLVLCCSRQL